MTARYSGKDLLQALPESEDRWDEAVIASLRTPALVITGEHDAPARVRAADALSEALPCAQRACVPAARHIPSLDNPLIYNAVLRTFLERHAGSHRQENHPMPNVLVLYYSSYGHLEAMAQAQAAGARRIPGAAVEVKRVPEIVPLDLCKASGFRLDQPAPVAEPAELERYDAIIFGTPTRFGNMAAQMRNFLDQTGPLWTRGALVGKVGSVFCATASQHGGQETTLTSFHLTLLHHGMIIVGLPYTFKDLTTLREVTGGTPYGASCVTGVGGELRMPTALELEMCRFQGEHVTRIATKLAAA